MATKNIKKILLNKDGDNFVADIENIENRISQNSSNLETAKQELSSKCNEALSQAKAYTDQEKAKYLPLTGIAAHAKLADTATTATKADYAISAASATNSVSATKASQNASGHALADTIVKAIAINGRIITITKLDGQTYTLTTQDTNTTYSKLSQFTNDSGYITNSHNFANGIIINGIKLTIG